MYPGFSFYLPNIVLHLCKCQCFTYILFYILREYDLPVIWAFDMFLVLDQHSWASWQQKWELQIKYRNESMLFRKRYILNTNTKCQDVNLNNFGKYTYLSYCHHCPVCWRLILLSSSQPFLTILTLVPCCVKIVFSGEGLLAFFSAIDVVDYYLQRKKTSKSVTNIAGK